MKNQITDEQYIWFVKTFGDLVAEAVKKKVGTPLYYEVWIDFKESAPRYFLYAYNWTNLAIECLANWLIRRDRWYWSPEYVSALNRATEKVGVQKAFGKVLHNKQQTL